MKRSNTNDVRKISKFLPLPVKALGIFLLCFAHFYCGQIYISEGAAIHLKEGAEITQTKTIEKLPANIIYITSETSVSNLSGGNFEVISISKIKKDNSPKVALSKRKKKSSVKTELAPVKLAQTDKRSVEVFNASSDSESVFSATHNFGSGIFHAQTSFSKHILKSFDQHPQISFSGLCKAKISDYTAEYKSQRELRSFSIRPPPFS